MIAVVGVAVAGVGLAVGWRIETKPGFFRHRATGTGKGLANARAIHQADSLSRHNVLTPFQDLGSLKTAIFAAWKSSKKARFHHFGMLA
jgi:hypothetical protein